DLVFVYRPRFTARRGRARTSALVRDERQNGKRVTGGDLPMRVLLVAHRFPPDNVGGVESYTQRLAGELVKTGDTVHIVARRWGENTILEPQLLREQLADGSILHRISIGGDTCWTGFSIITSASNKSSPGSSWKRPPTWSTSTTSSACPHGLSPSCTACVSPSSFRYMTSSLFARWFTSRNFRRNG